MNFEAVLERARKSVACAANITPITSVRDSPSDTAIVKSMQRMVASIASPEQANATRSAFLKMQQSGAASNLLLFTAMANLESHPMVENFAEALRWIGCYESEARRLRGPRFAERLSMVAQHAGTCLFKQRDYLSALERFSEAFELFPAPEHFTNMLCTLGALGRPQEGWELFQETHSLTEAGGVPMEFWSAVEQMVQLDPDLGYLNVRKAGQQ